jgi:hypothetical protein
MVLTVKLDTCILRFVEKLRLLHTRLAFLQKAEYKAKRAPL